MNHQSGRRHAVRGATKKKELIIPCVETVHRAGGHP